MASKRNRAQIRADLAPLTAAEHLDCKRLKTDIFDALTKGEHLGEDDPERLHSIIRMQAHRIDHLETLNQTFRRSIHGMQSPDEPLKEPDPIDERTAAVKAAIDAGASLADALKEP